MYTYSCACRGQHVLEWELPLQHGQICDSENCDFSVSVILKPQLSYKMIKKKLCMTCMVESPYSTFRFALQIGREGMEGGEGVGRGMVME